MSTKALQHMIAWAIQHTYMVQKEGLEIIDNKELSDTDKMLKIKGPNGTDYRLLNLILLLKPVIEEAKKEYPEQESFFNWFDEKWAFIEENKMVQGPCGCKGCKTE